MLESLASANVPVSSDWKLALVLTYLGMIAAAGVLVFLPIRLARGRRRRVDLIAAAAVVWGVASALVFLPAVTNQMKWSNEQTTLIESGYYDPQDATAAPRWPWVATTAVAGAYVALFTWALAGRRISGSASSDV